MAEAEGVHCAIGSNLEWNITFSARAHIAIALPNIQVERYGADIIGGTFHIDDATQTPLTATKGRVTVP